MKKAVWLIGILILGMIFFGCTRQQGSSTQDTSADKELALKFLQGLQDGDKNKMYEASNLTPEIVNESREKLVHSKQSKLTEHQSREFEHALRISGQIDFFLAKMRPMFPKSSSYQIMQTTVEESTNDIRHIQHLVKITYLNKDEAMRDKKGKLVKEMTVRLQELTQSVTGRPVHGFSFSSKDFEKFADRDFEVLSYF